MTQADIGKAMRRLPRTAASPRFKSDVLRAVRAEYRPRIAWRLMAATAMVMILLVGTYAASVHREQRRRIQALRTEQQQIKSELHRVKAIADEARPVVVLENGDTRVILASQPIYY